MDDGVFGTLLHVLRGRSAEVTPHGDRLRLGSGEAERALVATAALVGQHKRRDRGLISEHGQDRRCARARCSDGQGSAASTRFELGFVDSDYVWRPYWQAFHELPKAIGWQVYPVGHDFSCDMPGDLQMQSDE